MKKRVIQAKRKVCHSMVYILLILGALVLAPAASQAQMSFEIYTTYGEGIRHSGLLMEDFNKDNLADLALSNRFYPYSGTDFISILSGSASGSFQPPAEFPAGYGPTEVIGGDFNNDGNADIVAAHGDYTLKIFAGYSDGSFMAYTTAVNLESSGGMLAKADFNNDGNMDIARTNYANYAGVPTVSVFTGNGNGTFTPFSSIWDSKQLPTTIHSADFNNDGNADLAVSYPWAPQIGIFPGNGDGTFADKTLYIFSAWGLHNNNFSIEDVNFDGSPDLVGLPNHVSGIANTLINDGFGLFSTITWNNLSTISPRSMVTADFNCDGRHDMAIEGTDRTDSLGKLFIYAGNGDGTFQYDSKYTLPGTLTFPVLPYNSLIAAGDMNGDGRPDIAVKNSSYYEVSVYLNATPLETNYCSTNPDIKANGSDGPLVINQGDMLDLTVSLDPGFAVGVDSDSWVYGVSEAMGTYWYQLGTGWVASETPIPAYQGPLAAVTDLNVLSMSTLPAGVYDFYFQIDERNDIKEGARSDTVNVTIQ